MRNTGINFISNREEFLNMQVRAEPAWASSLRPPPASQPGPFVLPEALWEPSTKWSPSGLMLDLMDPFSHKASDRCPRPSAHFVFVLQVCRWTSALLPGA